MVSVFFYVPNLIGYARLVLLFGFYMLAFVRWRLAAVCYVLSFAGDLFDGYFARKLGQSSSFGYVLDMVTDRIATAGLLSVLGALRPDSLWLFGSLQGLDLASHWFHMYSTMTTGGHHKSAETLKARNFVLRAYYSSYPLFAYLCVGAELTYVALYVLFYSPELSVGPVFLKDVCLYLFAPACVLKNVVNVAQLCSASQLLVKHGDKGGKDT